MANLEHHHIADTFRDLDKCCVSHRAINLHLKLCDAPLSVHGGRASIMISSKVMAELMGAKWHRGTVSNGVQWRKSLTQID